jgi:hypothetical protein
MNIRYDEDNHYLSNNPVPQDFFRPVPCVKSTEGNEHIALVISKSDRTDGTCYQCQHDAMKSRTAKRPAAHATTFVDAVEESND